MIYAKTKCGILLLLCLGTTSCSAMPKECGLNIMSGGNSAPAYCSILWLPAVGLVLVDSALPDFKHKEESKNEMSYLDGLAADGSSLPGKLDSGVNTKGEGNE